MAPTGSAAAPVGGSAASMLVHLFAHGGTNLVIIYNPRSAREPEGPDTNPCRTAEGIRSGIVPTDVQRQEKWKKVRLKVRLKMRLKVKAEGEAGG